MPEATGNSFLDSLPSTTRVRLLPALQKTLITSGLIIGEAGAPIEQIVFPIRSIISTVTEMVDGSAVEVGFTGHEGFGGLSIAFGSKMNTHSIVVQIPDSAYQIDAQFFLAQMNVDAVLKERALAYAEYAFIAAAQYAACNRLHPIEQRYARWMLMAHDRVGADEYSLTHEFVAQMLGVRRPAVTIVAGSLSKSSIIAYNRARVRVLDVSALEATACECYGALTAHLKRLMGYGPRFSNHLSQVI